MTNLIDGKQSARPEAGVCSEHLGELGPRVAHIASAKGSMVALCGYLGKGRMTKNEARSSPWCVVCIDLYGSDYDRGEIK